MDSRLKDLGDDRWRRLWRDWREGDVSDLNATYLRGNIVFVGVELKAKPNMKNINWPAN